MKMKKLMCSLLFIILMLMTSCGKKKSDDTINTLEFLKQSGVVPADAVYHKATHSVRDFVKYPKEGDVDNGITFFGFTFENNDKTAFYVYEIVDVAPYNDDYKLNCYFVTDYKEEPYIFNNYGVVAYKLSMYAYELQHTYNLEYVKDSNTYKLVD